VNFYLLYEMNREGMLTDAVCSERIAFRREFRTCSAASLCVPSQRGLSRKRQREN